MCCLHVRVSRLSRVGCGSRLPGRLPVQVEEDEKENLRKAEERLRTCAAEAAFAADMGAQLQQQQGAAVEAQEPEQATAGEGASTVMVVPQRLRLRNPDVTEQGATRSMHLHEVVASLAHGWHLASHQVRGRADFLAHALCPHSQARAEKRLR